MARPREASKGGLVLLNSTSFSGVTSISVNNVFNSSYTRYRILYDATLSVNDGLYFRLRSSGTDSTGTNYGQQVLRADSTSAAAVRVANTTWDIDYTRNSGNQITELELFNPFASSPTYGFSRYTAKLLLDTTQVYFVQQGFIHTASTSYDGFTLYTGTATTGTGTIQVYGYRK
jgi:hypothetical protein